MHICRSLILLAMVLMSLGVAHAQEAGAGIVHDAGCGGVCDGDVRREYKRISNIEVHFRFNSYDIDMSYLGNEASLRRFSNTIDSIGLDRIDSVVVVSKSSPEGVYEHNVLLSKRRAATMRNYLLERHPEIREYLIIHDDEESWSELRDYVVRDTLMKQSTIDKVVAVIDADVNVGTKKWRMEQLPIYRYLRTTYYPLLRNSTFFILYYNDDVVAEEPVVEMVEGIASTAPDELLSVDTAPLDFTPMSMPSPSAVDAAADDDVAEHKREEQPWRRRLHVKSNALGLSLAITNVAVEVDINKHLSLSLPVYYAAHNYFTQTIKFRTLAVQPELRYWFKSTMRGLFAGAHFSYAQYNIALNGDYRYQDHRGGVPLLGGGLSVGYRMPISSNGRWHVEFSVGAGVYRLHYDKFYNTPDTKDGLLVESVKRTYWGLDNASVTFSYSFDLKRKGGRR